MFSYFNNLTSKRPTDCLTFHQLSALIRDHPSRDRIARLHKVAYKGEEYVLLKEKLPVVTAHAMFTASRKLDDFMKVSGYLYFDIDASALSGSPEQMKQEIIRKYKHLISLVGVSVDGRGLFFYVKVEGLIWDNFPQVHAHFREKLFVDIPTDPEAGGIGRVHIIPYDPNVYYNPDVSSSIPEGL